MSKTLHNLMILGASSDAGKSLLATALCRWFSNKGYNTQAFKSQNMSLNAVVTPEGDEIGVAQKVQALAARQIPSHLNNPILLKPQGGHVSQIIVKGQVVDKLSAKDYYKEKDRFAKQALESFNELEASCDLVVLEGAGSPVELNLTDKDIANLFMARAADAKCILVVNIELGGFFASTYGTLELLEPEDRKRFVGVVVNNFRGDPSLFINDLKSFEEKIGLPILGVLPHIDDLALDVEDSVSLNKFRSLSADAEFQVRVIRLPHISNFNEFQIFEHCPNISWAFTENAEDLKEADLVIVPGTKTTLDDLKWLKEKGFDKALSDHVAKDKKLMGICGGFQILGKKITDSEEVAEGLGLFDMQTVFGKEKVLKEVVCKLSGSKTELKAFELHMGTGAANNCETWLQIEGRSAGFKQGNVYGSYCHGLFENKDIMQDIFGAGDWQDMQSLRENTFEQLAECIDKHLDMKALVNALQLQTQAG